MYDDQVFVIVGKNHTPELIVWDLTNDWTQVRCMASFPRIEDQLLHVLHLLIQGIYALLPFLCILEIGKEAVI